MENQRKKLISLGQLFLACLWISVLPCLSVCLAEQLPLKSYRSTDGLGSDSVNCMVQDSRGFLWFCTTFGLSRFDGQQFTTYGEKQGITYPTINDLIETRQGVYWVATNGRGVFRLDPRDGNSRFTNYPIAGEPATNRINVLYEDRSGHIWAGSDAGLFRLDANSNKFLPVTMGIPSHPDREVQVWEFAEDTEGSLWMGTKFGVVRRLPRGWASEQMLHYPVGPTTSGRDLVRALMFDRAGRLWIGHESWLVVFKPQPLASIGIGQISWGDLQTGGIPNGLVNLPDSPGEARTYAATVRALCQSSDGFIWIGTRDMGLIEFDGQRLRRLTMANGLSGHNILTHGLLESRDGSLWISLLETGVMRLRRSGFVTYKESDGLEDKSTSFLVASALAENRLGGAGVWYSVNAGWHISFVDERFLTGSNVPHFSSVRLNVPLLDSTWGASRHALRDHAGEWWVATSEGLYRFPRVERIEQLSRARPLAVYTTRDGLVKDDVTRLFEDSRGDLWISTFAPEREIVARWERATGRFHRYGERDGLQPFSAAAGFCEDSAGQVWIGFREDGLARYAAGQFTIFGAADGIKGSIASIHRDAAGRLWVATSLNGLVRIDDPVSAHPRFTVYSDKLASRYVSAITEDAEGRIYAATALGVDRLDPVTGQVKHFTIADGLASVPPLAAFRDPQGALWFGTLQGLSRLIPQPDREQPPPPVFINGLRIAGKEYPVPDFGQTEVASLELEPSLSQIQIAYFGLNFTLDEPLRYQYRLEGGNQDWSAPTEQRTVELSLSPGRYRFLVRAVRPDGALSQAPAAFSFRILRPIWQRWWFLSLAVALLASALIAAERFRVARLMERRQAAEALRRSKEERLLELERVRRRIATELHDDIGTSLSRIAILTEVVKQQTGPLNLKTGKLLNDISGSARELLDSISDVVWAIDPRRDDFTHIISRLRQFAADVLGGQRIAWEFNVAPEIEELKLKPEPRRQIYLIFKEAINNIAKHAHCISVTLKLELSDGQLVAEIHDDGCGFAAPSKELVTTETGRGGHGLGNMRLRAEQLGGRLRIESTPGNGTHLILQIPFSHIVT